MSDPSVIKAIKEAVTIPVMAKARIGHFVEAQILEALGIDYIDESEVLTPADDIHHINKHNFKVPFVCGCRDLGEALRRIAEGAAMIRTKGEAGTGNVVEVRLAAQPLSFQHLPLSADWLPGVLLTGRPARAGRPGRHPLPPVDGRRRAVRLRQGDAGPR